MAAKRNEALAESVEEIKNEQEYRDRISKVRHGLVIVLVLFFIVFVAIALLAISKVGYAAFVGNFSKFNPLMFGAALLAVFIAYVMRFPKWSLYLKRLRVKIPLKKDFLIYMSMYSMDITPGRWGRSIVSYTINKLTGVHFLKTFPAVVADIFTDSLGFCVIAIVSALVIGKFALLSLLVIFLLLLPFVFLYLRGPFLFVKKYLYRYRFLRGYLDRGDLYFESHSLLGIGSYVYSMIFTIPSMFLTGTALYLVILSFGINLPFSYIWVVLFIYSSSLLVGMLSGIPGTLGVTDGLLIGSLTLLLGNYIDFGMAAAVTIVFRAATVWFVQLFGFISLLHTTNYWHKKPLSRANPA